MAQRGHETLRYGPMRPIGLQEGDTRHYAVIQLRAENAQKSLYNLVGFQTRLKWGAQKQIFQMVPALKNAVFARLGTMHRNTFIESPLLLDASQKLKLTPEGCPPLWFAGQITGAEGYTEALATGWHAAWRMAGGKELPPDSCVRSLVEHLVAPNPDFQPMNFNFGLLPRPSNLKKSQRKEFQIQEEERAVAEFLLYL
jgi:methylenetetrahydrofolate--tRNA-(uracil-5-)-methyltransferase